MAPGRPGPATRATLWLASRCWRGDHRIRGTGPECRGWSQADRAAVQCCPWRAVQAGHRDDDQLGIGADSEWGDEKFGQTADAQVRARAGGGVLGLRPWSGEPAQREQEGAQLVLGLRVGPRAAIPLRGGSMITRHQVVSQLPVGNERPPFEAVTECAEGDRGGRCSGRVACPPGGLRIRSSSATCSEVSCPARRAARCGRGTRAARIAGLTWTARNEARSARISPKPAVLRPARRRRGCAPSSSARGQANLPDDDVQADAAQFRAVT